MKPDEIRSCFLRFFEERGHKVYSSASLIPQDPSILFTVAGMVPFKDFFLGKEKPNYPRAVSVQRCIRTNDLERVGKTARHLTFFEMLGNFSFGDYFKEDAITWAWEFLTKELSLPKDRLYISIFKEDVDSEKIWKGYVDADRIIKLGEEDNFWKMGETGPCGPCSEILFDLGGDVGCKRQDCRPGCSCDRFLEVWNLVFTEFDRKEDGTLVSLPKKNIDTGMGLERLSAIVGGYKTSFECELIAPIIQNVNSLANSPSTIASRVIADHIRAITHLIYDGIIPSNEERGYILRSLIRRAERQGKTLGIIEPFLYKLVYPVSLIFPYLKEDQSHIANIIKLEETRFYETLKRGYSLLSEKISKSKDVFSGKDLFELYDTYGFPKDEAIEIIKEAGLSVDIEGYYKMMDEQKERGRKRAIFSQKGERYNIKTEFIGYETLSSPCKVIKQDGMLVILDKTPFYPEMGGQIGDCGILTKKDNIKIYVEDTQRDGETIIHKIKEGNLAEGEIVQASVDKERRDGIKRAHTATHLLQASLREVLGKNVRQQGSLVENDRLRFDFNYPSKLSSSLLENIERMVNTRIMEDIEVVVLKDIPMKEAKALGALAFFEDEYKELVRVVQIGESRELCGGTHIERTGKIGLFTLTHEGSVSSGIRRIEGYTGMLAHNLMKEDRERLKRIMELVKASKNDVLFVIEELERENKEKEKEIIRLKNELLQERMDKIIGNAKEINGIKTIFKIMEGVDKNEVLQAVDKISDKLKSGVVILGGIEKEKILWVCRVTKDLTKRIGANSIIKEISKITGGGGGGSPGFATGGGCDISKIKEAKEKIEGLLEKAL